VYFYFNGMSGSKASWLALECDLKGWRCLVWVSI
jgi:hypothetical protein